MSIHRRLVAGLLLLLALAHAQQHFFDDSAEEFKYESVLFVDKVDHVKLDFNFETMTLDANLLMLKLQSIDDDLTIWLLTVELEAGVLRARFVGGLKLTIDAFVSNARAHHVSVDLNLLDGQLLMALDSRLTQIVNFDLLELPVNRLTLSLGNGNAPMGCIGDPQLIVNEALVALHRSDMQLPDVLDDFHVVCPDPCEELICSNNGNCINHYTMGICDCSLSSMEGPDCTSEPTVLTLKRDQLIDQKITPKIINGLQTIAFEVKTDPQMHGIKYLDLKLIAQDDLVEFSIAGNNNGSLTVITGDLVELLKSNFDFTNWVQFRLVFDFESKPIVIDLAMEAHGEHRDYQFFLPNDARISALDSTLEFGKCDDSCISESTCYRRVYIEHENVILKLKNSRPDVQVNGPIELDRCTWSAAPVVHTKASQEKPEPPIVSAQKKEIAKHLFDDVTLECRIESDLTPSRIYWTFEDMAVVNKTAKYTIELVESVTGKNFVSMLHISELTESDFGLYQCFADNDAGGDEDKILLTQSTEEEPVVNGDAHVVDHEGKHITHSNDLNIGGLGTSWQRSKNCNFTCYNDGACYEHAVTNEKRCICGFDFSGALCQFAELPSSCNEAFLLGDTNPGATPIDLDGSGPLNQLFVWCDMYNEFGVTVVDTNLNNQTVLRNNFTRAHGVQIDIAYRNMNDEQLKRLITDNQCYQWIKYECIKAPLRLGKKTWFETVFGWPFAQIGLVPEQCPCAESKQCQEYDQGARCHCDWNGAKKTADSGWLHGKQAGVKTIYALPIEGQELGEIWLGPLYCNGSESLDEAITFVTQESFVEVVVWELHNLTLWLKTSNANGVIVQFRQSDGSVMVQIEIDNERCLALNYRLGAEQRKVTTCIASKLNDNKWKRVQLLHSHGQLRLALQRSTFDLNLSEQEVAMLMNFDSMMTLGGAEDVSNGYVGCMRSIYVNGEYYRPQDKFVSIASSAGGRPAIDTSGCNDECAKSRPCANGAHCIPHYNRTFTCNCVNKFAQSGDKCQHDLNRPSPGNNDITLAGAYLKYNENTLPVNAVSANLTLSIRTDQDDGLVLYALDENYNFVQIHHEDKYTFVLTINSDDSVYRCNVNTNRKNYAYMDWVQLAIVYTSDAIVFHVNEQQCRLDLVRRLATTYYHTFKVAKPYMNETVFPPKALRAPQGDVKLAKFQYTYIGDVPRAPHRVRRQSDMGTFYYTVIPPFYGCMRGMKIGDRFMNTTELGNAERSARGFISLEHCTAGQSCQRQRCANEGECRVRWSRTQHDTHCDCRSTSYTGERCEQEHAIAFNNATGLQYSLRDSIGRTPVGRRADVFTMAFATIKPGTLAHFLWSNESAMTMFIDATTMALTLRMLDAEYRFSKVVVTDNVRHLVQIVRKRDRVIIKIDNEELKIATTENKQLQTFAELNTVYFGSLLLKDGIVLPNFVGCLSNAQFEFDIAPTSTSSIDVDYSFQLRPFEFYARAAGPDQFNFVSATGGEGASLQGTSTCSALKNSRYDLPTRIPALPPWNEKQASARPFDGQPPESLGGHDGVLVSDSSRTSGTVLLAALILLLLVIIAVVAVCFYRCQQKNSRRKSIDRAPTRQSAGALGLDNLPTQPLLPEANKNLSRNSSQRTNGKTPLRENPDNSIGEAQDLLNRMSDAVTHYDREFEPFTDELKQTPPREAVAEIATLSEFRHSQLTDIK